MQGTVLRAQSGFFWVQTDAGMLECTAARAAQEGASIQRHRGDRRSGRGQASLADHRRDRGG